MRPVPGPLIIEQGGSSEQGQRHRDPEIHTETPPHTYSLSHRTQTQAGTLPLTPTDTGAPLQA